MHINAFTTAQSRHVAQALYEYWHSSRSMIRAESIQVISQLHCGRIDGFRRYVAQLVRRFFLCPSFVTEHFVIQRDLQTIFECTKELHLNLGSTNTDISLMQECVALATQYPELSGYWTDAIALVLTMMDAAQRDSFRFDRLYPDALEVAVFGGTEADPIVIFDEDAD